MLTMTSGNSWRFWMTRPPVVAVTAERAFLARLEGGCVVPVAALGRVEGDSLVLSALISDLEGRRV